MTMCSTCDREVEMARNLLGDLIKEYEGAVELVKTESIEVSTDEHLTALAHRLNHGVTEHYGVINGLIAAAAIQRLAGLMAMGLTP
jgi:hypothetical protein